METAGLWSHLHQEGFQHTFASEASKRMQAAHLMTLSERARQSELEQKRDRGKKRKVADLEQARPCASKAKDKNL
jgi:hypothetical protein